MFDQLMQLVQQYGNEAVVKNNDVPNEMNDQVMGEASNTILSGLQGALASGGEQQVAGLFEGNNASSSSNPIVSMITNQLVTNLGAKFGLSGAAASGVASTLIPKVLGSLIGNAKDPNHKGLEVSDIIGAITGGNQGSNSGLMSAIGSLLGGAQNNTSDNNATPNGGGIGDILGKIFG